ncbi:NADPH-dependent F420 reductase [Brevibacterium litoralis]|uniref:NADPH-dependent F420 reductase n=1 Tax=Brevibacterium litoralis TaxID=3138935 RepID=UPI0032EC5950
MSRIAILGAGKVGTVLARLALAVGHEVHIAGSGPASQIALTVEVLAPGAQAAEAPSPSDTTVLDGAELVVLALPLGRFTELDPTLLTGHVVVDAMNHWRETDGDRPDLSGPGISTSHLVQEHLAGATVVKGFNHMGYHDLEAGARPAGDPDRRALAIAGDDSAALARVASVVDDLGFDPLVLDSLAAGIHLQPGNPSFGANLSVDALRALLPAAATLA